MSSCLHKRKQKNADILHAESRSVKRAKYVKNIDIASYVRQQLPDVLRSNESVVAILWEYMVEVVHNDAQSGTMICDQKQGVWLYTQDDPNIDVEQTMETYWDGKLNGAYEASGLDATVLRTQFRNDFMHGNCLVKKNNGDQVLVKYVYGYRHGDCVTRGSFGELVSVYRYHMGELHGPYEMYYRHNSNICTRSKKCLKETGAYYHNKLNGKKSHYNSNGVLSFTEYYKDGMLDGQSVIYNDQGRVYHRSMFKQGQRHGLYESWSDNEHTECWYEYGWLHGMYRKWNNQGALVQSVNYVRGYRHGTLNETFEDGSHLIIDYVYGVEHGKVQSKTAVNGTYTVKRSACDGKTNGVLQRFNMNGMWTGVDFYRNDEMVGLSLRCDEAGKVYPMVY